MIQCCWYNISNFVIDLAKKFCHQSFCAVIGSVKSVHIRSFSGPYFPAFGLNTERHSGYSASLCIHSECEKIQTRKTPNTDTFHSVNVLQSIQKSNFILISFSFPSLQKILKTVVCLGLKKISPNLIT